MSYSDWNKRIDIRPMNELDIPLFLKWAQVPHVRDTWFVPGYLPPEYIHTWVAGNGYDYPCILELDGTAIGFLLYCDLAAYTRACPDGGGAFHGEPPGTYSIDMFIADEKLLGKGLGTALMRLVVSRLLTRPDVHRLVIDPAETNTRAIRCYEKVGFQTFDRVEDGVTNVLLMEYRAPA